MLKINEYVEKLESAFSTIDLPSEPSNLYDPIRYFLKIGGKRIRPVLTLMSAEMYGKDEEAINQALAVELFHNFTLIHDDIMDEAPVRRGKETVHNKWNQTIAILSGDALMIKAYQSLCLSSGSKAEELMTVFNKMALEVCEGQQMDMDFEEIENVTVAEYIEMIRLKTSVLLGCALELGAIIGDASIEDRKLLNTFGQHIGIAFQIKDDILDLYADPDKFGKQVGGDILANKKTILHLTAQNIATIEQREIMKQLIVSQDPILKVKRTKELYDHLQIKQQCEERMKEHYTKALKAVDELSVESEKKTPLKELAIYLIEREL